MPNFRLRTITRKNLWRKMEITGYRYKSASERRYSPSADEHSARQRFQELKAGSPHTWVTKVIGYALLAAKQCSRTGAGMWMSPAGHVVATLQTSALTT